MNRVQAPSLVNEMTAKFGPYIGERLTHNACLHRGGFYLTVMKLMAPAVVVWLVVQSVAAIKGDNTSRWVDILAVLCAFSAFTIAWYFVVDKPWQHACL